MITSSQIKELISIAENDILHLKESGIIVSVGMYITNSSDDPNFNGEEFQLWLRKENTHNPEEFQDPLTINNTPAIAFGKDFDEAFEYLKNILRKMKLVSFS